MYQAEAGGSVGVRFYMPCHSLAVFVCAYEGGGCWHIHTIKLQQWAIYHKEQIILRGFL